ncbi:structural protein [Providencia rettgeri]|uniref:structural protein n=1 Tax=Providencia rettgeri TaxID=587 RepID=UPI001B368DDE|nr:structural protein [Providencia rettgeri]MBQ0327189.1 structural protein [Providencia rettgeri]
MTKQTRGIRNNNPGNIDYNKANNWKGQLPHNSSIESRFCRFQSAEYGIRALIRLLQNYQRNPKINLKTISGLINRWAPNNENNTGAYINGVAKELGVSPTDIVSLDDKATAIKLAKAIIRHENGSQPYDEATFEKAWGLL